MTPEHFLRQICHCTYQQSGTRGWGSTLKLNQGVWGRAQFKLEGLAERFELPQPPRVFMHPNLWQCGIEHIMSVTQVLQYCKLYDQNCVQL